MIKYKSLLRLITVSLLSLVFLLTPNYKHTVKAEESITHKDLDIVSISPPTIYEINESLFNIIFKVYFNGDITYANYKHMAMKAKDLKSTVGYANPDLTSEAVDFFENNGILASLNNCIEFNGKKVKEYQKYGACNCMIHLGELGVNNCMNIEFSSSCVDLSKELKDNYQFKFITGLKLPSGGILKEDSTWNYSLNDKTFDKKDLSYSDSNAGFIVNYNGKNLTKEDNCFTIKNKESFTLDNLYVKPNNSDAKITIEKDFGVISEGLNYIFISCTSKDGKETEDLQIAVRYVEEDKNNEETNDKVGCFASLSTTIVVSLFSFLLCGFVIRRKKI